MNFNNSLRRQPPTRVGCRRYFWPTLWLCLFALLLGGCGQAEKPAATAKNGALKIKPILFNELNDTEDYNASGVVPLDDGRFLFCDNHVNDALFELDLTAVGQQQGALIRHPLQGVNTDAIDDLEGMTLAEENGKRFIFAASSLSLKKAIQNLGDKPTRVPTDGLLRITVNQDHGLSAENLTGFRAWLVEHAPELPELKAAATLAPNNDGLNIEGLAWDRQRHALLFGLRSPVPDGKPLVLAVKVKDLAGAWTTANLEMLPAIHLTLAEPQKDEAGIRTLEFIEPLNAFLVVLGKSTDDSTAPFSLCVWDGQAAGVLRQLPIAFSKKMKPEGLTAGTVGGKPVLLFVDDGGGYQSLPLEALPRG